MNYVKFIVLFLLLFLGIVLNMEHSFISRLGFEMNYLVAAGVSFLISWLALNHHVFVVAVLVIMATAANLPEATAAGLGYDRDIMLAALIAVILLPLIIKFFDLD